MTSGIALRLTTAALITFMSACVHAVSDQASLGQIIFWRSAIALIPITGYMLLRGEFLTGIRTQDPRAHISRSILGSLAMACSFLSLAYLPIANATALAYLVPILSLPAAAILLGERLTRPVILGTALGFAGVIMMLADTLTAPDFTTKALIGFAAGIGYALTMTFLRIHIKRMTESETPAAIAFYFALVSGLIGFATFPLGWAEVDTSGLVALIGAGLFGGLAHIAATESIARAPVAVLAPYDYTGMIWALGLDMILFAHLPGTWALAGVLAITTGATLAVLAPSRKSKRQEFAD